MGVPGNADLLLLRSAAAAGGYQVERSLRFNSSDSAYLSRTPASSGNRKTWTWAAWVKRSAFPTGGYNAGAQELFTAYSASNDAGSTEILFLDNQLTVNGWSGTWRKTTAVYRDPSAWYHIVVALDTTQATASNRLKIYVNGTQVTDFATSTDPTQNADLGINNASAHAIGRWSYTSPLGYFDGYLADIHFIDGQALTPSSFTEVSATTGQLIPKAYTGSFGTNGFWLKFSDNSAATATTLGKDYSGNGNNWTPNNFSVLSNYTDTFLSRKPDGTSWTNPTYAFDGTTANYADGTAGNGTVSTIRFNKPLTGVTLLEYFYDGTSTYGYNSTDVGTGPNLTGGSWVTVYSGSAITVNNVRCTSQPGNGVIRLYAIRVNGTILNNWTETDPPGCDSTVDTPTSYGTDTGAGGEVRGNYATLNPLGTAGATPTNGNLSVSSSSTVGNRISTFFLTSGKWYWEGSGNGYVGAIVGRGGESFTGSISGSGSKAIGWWEGGPVYWDGGDNGGSTTFTSTDVIGIALDMDAGNIRFYKNNSLIYTITFGSGTVPNLSSGVFPAYNVGASTKSVDLNFGQRPFAYTAPTGFKALCDTNLPAPVVAKPSTVMDVALWTGNGSARSITGLGFNPDLVWIKGRSGATDHALYDVVRGAQARLESNTTDAEVTSDGGVTAFNSDGFSLGTLAQVNTNSATYAGWAWDAGTTTSSNGSGSITSSVRANASAGFSIVTWTGNGATTTQTIGHGLNVSLGMVIVKARDSGSNDMGWGVSHASVAAPNYLYLNSTDAAGNAGPGQGQPSVGSGSTFSILAGNVPGTNNFNANGIKYVAYCFSPVAGYSSFGSYTSNYSADGPFIYTGFKPRFILIKNASDTTYTDNYSWALIDTQRFPYNTNPGSLNPLWANRSYQENLYGSGVAVAAQLGLDILSNGFKPRCANAELNYGTTYIYAAFAENPFQYARAR